MEIENMLIRLLNGEDVKEIVKERLEYLRSDEYQNSKSHIIYAASKGNEGALVKWQGFVPETFKVNAADIVLDCISSETNIYEEYLLYLKHLIETNKKTFEEVTKALPFYFIRNYFEHDCGSEYKEIVDAFKKDNFSLDDIREDMRIKIAEYTANKDKFKTFRDYIIYENKMHELEERKNELSDEELKELKEYYHLQKRTCSIGDLKGLGIGVAQCTELALCFQNLCSFIGYDVYTLAGILNGEGHNFNVVKKDGEWALCDVATEIYYPLNDDFDVDAFINGDCVINIGNSKYTQYNEGRNYIDISYQKTI